MEEAKIFKLLLCNFHVFLCSIQNHIQPAVEYFWSTLNKFPWNTLSHVVKILLPILRLEMVKRKNFRRKKFHKIFAEQVLKTLFSWWTFFIKNSHFADSKCFISSVHFDTRKLKILRKLKVFEISWNDHRRLIVKV